MKWLENINNIFENKETGKCPFCNSENTNYRIVRFAVDFGSCDIWCEDCKKAFHMSRVKVSEDILRNVELPKELNFKNE